MDPAEKRRSEIEAKKAKLAELRRLRGERQSSFPLPRNGSATGEARTTYSRLGDRNDIDELVNSLIGESSALRNAHSAPRISSEEGSKESKKDTPPRESETGSTLNGSQSTFEQNPRTTSTVVENTAQTILRYEPDSKGLGADRQESTSVQAGSRDPKPMAAREVITYSKATQTQIEPLLDTGNKISIQESHDDLIARLREEIEAELKVKEAEEGQTTVADHAPVIRVPKLSSTEKDKLLKSAELTNFLDRSAKVIERALKDDFDVLVDYKRHTETDRLDSNRGKLQEVVQFTGERTKRRMITSIDWSPRYNELMLASYSKDRTNMNEEMGLVHVWNTRFPQRPEFTFHCQSEVQHAIFSPHHPMYVIGGSYSGQILLWDTRAKNQPVLQSPLSGKGHTFPITGLNIVGTKQANSIVSTSSDGTVCTWSIDMLARPQEVIELALLPPSKVEEVSPTAVSITPTDTSAFLVGTEDGNMYSVNRLDRAGAKAGIDPKVVYKGHAAMITGVAHHSFKGAMDLSDLVLTSSLDWTVRLWRARPQASFPVGIDGQSAFVQSPLLEFQQGDMVYDVKWSPTRPGVFASVDGTGECQIYDLCQSHEVPIAKGIPSVNSGAPGARRPRALNKVVWDHEEGRRLAVAGADGVLTVFEVPDTLGGKEPNAEQYHALNARLKYVGK